MIAYFSNWILFFPLAFSLFVAMRLSQGSIDQGKSSWVLLTIRCFIALLMTFAVLSVGFRPSPVTVVWVLLLAVFSFVIYWKSRRLERSAMLLTAMSAETFAQQQLLAAMFYDENRGWLRRKGNALRRDLAAGVPWNRALEMRGVAVGVYERIALRLQSAYGREHDQRNASGEVAGLESPMRIEAEAERLLGRMFMFSWSIMIPLVVSLIMTFIVPTFKEMFEEFGLELPQSTQWMIRLADGSVEYGIAHLLAMLPMALFAIAIACFAVWLFPSLMQLGPLRWFTGEYYQTAGFAALASVVNKESNLLAACRETAELVPVPYIARRYRAATMLLENGASPADALVKSRLLSKSDLTAFGQGLDQRDPAWGFRQLASWKLERMLNRYALLVQVFVVGVTLVFACVVGLVAVGLMEALASMISAIS